MSSLKFVNTHTQAATVQKLQIETNNWVFHQNSIKIWIKKEFSEISPMQCLASRQ